MPSLARLCLLSAMAVSLSGCGAESVGTAAVAAKQKQQEIEQAEQMKASVQQQLDAAQTLEQQRLKEAESH